MFGLVKYILRSFFRLENCTYKSVASVDVTHTAVREQVHTVKKFSKNVHIDRPSGKY